MGNGYTFYIIQKCRLCPSEYTCAEYIFGYTDTLPNPLIPRRKTHTEIMLKSKNTRTVILYIYLNFVLVSSVEDWKWASDYETKWVITTREQRTQRIRRFEHQPQMELSLRHEYENQPHVNWMPQERPEWLLFEIEMNLSIRRIQVRPIFDKIRYFVVMKVLWI